MKIKFIENAHLIVNDYNLGEEYSIMVKKDEVREVLAIEDNTYGYKDIHFAHKEVAEGIYHVGFIILE